MTIKMELRDELELPGHIVAYVTRDIVIKRIRELLDLFESKGWSKMNEIPESKDKEELKDLLKSLSLNVQF